MLEIHANYRILNTAAADKRRCVKIKCYVKWDKHITIWAYKPHFSHLRHYCIIAVLLEWWGVTFAVVLPLCIWVTSEVSPHLSHPHCCVIVTCCCLTAVQLYAYRLVQSQCQCKWNFIAVLPLIVLVQLYSYSTSPTLLPQTLTTYRTCWRFLQIFSL